MLVAITAALVVSYPASAQSAPLTSSDQPGAPELHVDWSGVTTFPTACVRRIPRDQMFVVPVLLRASLADSNNVALTVQADLLAQEVSLQILADLGGSAGDTPDLDSTLAPESVPARVTVTYRRDGSASRRAMSISGDTMATRMLTKAFDVLRDSSQAAMVWPDGYRADSIVVMLELSPAIVASNGLVRLDATRRPAFRVFRLLTPPMTAALAQPDQPVPRYPAEAEQNRVEAAVLLRFVVDTNGRALPETIRDIRPRYREGMSEDGVQYHDAFARSTRDAVVRWRFTPAHVGPCPVRQWVNLPIKFVAP